MKIKAIHCKTCDYVVYSRARHDFRSCKCGSVSVDGGPGYERLIYGSESVYDRVELDVPATTTELFNDWNNRLNNFGLVNAS